MTRNPPIGIQSRTDHQAVDLRCAIVGPMLASPAGLIRQGIIPGQLGQLLVTAASPAAMTVKVAPGVALLAGPAGSGGYYVTNEATQTLTIAASSSSAIRTDLVIVRVADANAPMSTAGGDNNAAIEVVTGTPGAGAPSVPVAKGSYLVLAVVTVPINATNIISGNVGGTSIANVAQTVASGGILPVAGSTARAALTPYVGMHVYECDTGATYAWTGSRWWCTRGPLDMDDEAYTPSAFSQGYTSAPVSWAAANTYARRSRSRGYVRGQARVVLGDNGPTFGGSGPFGISMPYAPASLLTGDVVGAWSWRNSSGLVATSGVLVYNSAYGVAMAATVDGYALVGTSYLYALTATFDYYSL